MKTKDILKNVLNGVTTDLASLIKEAEEGNGEHKLTLALVYENGYFGIQKDPAKAFEWAEQAFKDQQEIHPSDYGLIVCTLGKYYYLGIGVEKDIATGVSLYRKAAHNYYCKFACDALRKHYTGNKDEILEPMYRCKYIIIHEWGNMKIFLKQDAVNLATLHTPSDMTTWIDEFLTEMETKQYPKSKELIINPS